MRNAPFEPLRIALLAGSLGQGGAEKQIYYIAQALQETGVQLRIYSLTQGEYYEPKLASLGIKPVWIGGPKNPLLRSLSLAVHLRKFRPHILQSTHYFSNLHAAVAARFLGIVSIGSIRSDPRRARMASRFWGPWLMGMPAALIANSASARQHAVAAGYPADKIRVLPNVIDLEDFDKNTGGQEDQAQETNPPGRLEKVTAAAVSRLEPVKRLDLFVKALDVARKTAPEVRGIIVGDGSQRAYLEKLAADLGLLPNYLQFLGRRDDVPAILSRVDMLLLTSEYEGFPNALLEAMAARLPVITVPAGDAGQIVQDGITGYVVPPETTPADSGQEATADKIAKHIVCLAQSPHLRRQLGDAGRERVKKTYGAEGLADSLLSIYQEIAQTRGNRHLLEVLKTRAIQS